MRRCRPRACDGERAFELILIQSYSRFFREAFEQEFYLRKLAKHGVRVVSITQPVGDESEPVHAMMRKVIALFERSIASGHTRRSPVARSPPADRAAARQERLTRQRRHSSISRLRALDGRLLGESYRVIARLSELDL